MFPVILIVDMIVIVIVHVDVVLIVIMVILLLDLLLFIRLLEFRMPMAAVLLLHRLLMLVIMVGVPVGPVATAEHVLPVQANEFILQVVKGTAVGATEKEGQLE